jgi:hypothetical protein
MTTPTFWSLVDRIEALWDELGLSTGCATRVPAEDQMLEQQSA